MVTAPGFKPWFYPGTDQNSRANRLILKPDERMALDVSLQPGADACAAIDEDPQPSICITTLFPRLTVDLAGGYARMYVSIRPNAALKEYVTVLIGASAPSNPSKVQLGEGAVGEEREVRVEPGNGVEDVPLLTIHTRPGNDQRGLLAYTLTARIQGSANPVPKIVGIPLNVSVQTNP